jgi:hypothetical protein
VLLLLAERFGGFGGHQGVGVVVVVVVVAGAVVVAAGAETGVATVGRGPYT